MAPFTFRRSTDIDSRALDRSKGRRPLSPQSKKMMWLLICNTLFSFFIYFGCVRAGFSEILLVYSAVAFALLVGYVIYNRGFVLRGATPDMLSDEWTQEQKLAMIAQAERRRESSRFVPAFLVPLLLAVLADAVYLLWLQDLLLSLEGLLG